jgi:hypothetical protein
MTISTEIEYASVDELYLDPLNPRLGRNIAAMSLSQEDLLNRMLEWSLEELAVSYIESGGFWSNEALLVVREPLYGSARLIVVEGNRRLAALILLRRAVAGESVPVKWRQIASSGSIPADLFTRVPYLLADSREDVQAFLGFRHVTGIKPWDADEKAAFIAKLVDEQGMTYEQVMRKIGSTTPTVRKHYVAYRVMLQIEDNVEDYDAVSAQNRFTVLYMSISTIGAQRYLNIDIFADPATLKYPVPNDKMHQLANFAKWLFGSRNRSVPQVVTDTRHVDKFGKILESDEAIAYLERADIPKFEVALRIAGGDEDEIKDYIERASDLIELSLTQVHLYKASVDIQHAVRRLRANVTQLLSIFPESSSHQ